MPQKRDYYEVLGVARTATGQELKSAFRKLALHLQAPVLDHARLVVARGQLFGYAVICQRRVNERRQRSSRNTLIDIEGRRETLLRAVELRIAGEADLQAVAEVGVDQRGVVDAVTTANDGLILTDDLAEDSGISRR